MERAIVLPYEHSMSLVAFVKIDRSTEPQITACTPTVVTYADVDYFYETALSETIITAHAVSVHPQQLVYSLTSFFRIHSLNYPGSGKLNRLNLPDFSVLC